ncbi:MAG: hypothetical protein RLY20_1973 [Verrucomicrobiota bacterium]
MYKILGGDGKEYGPISAETLRQWIAEGRANAQTQVLPEGAAAWQALGTIPEFAGSFGAPIGMTAGAIPSADASQMVAGPAVGLIVTAALGLLGQIAGIVMNLIGTGAGMAGARGAGEPAWANMMSGGIGVFAGIIGIIMSVVIFLGAQKMKKLESYNFAMTATIIAMVPCISPCCLVGLPIGIWALVILMKPEVKAAFQSN